MAWFTKKRVCVHCNANKTRREFEEHPTCPACRLEIMMAREDKRICPVDGATLVKEATSELLIDRCPQCNGIWLDAGELEAIKEVASDEGMTTGMILGIAS